MKKNLLWIGLIIVLFSCVSADKTEAPMTVKVVEGKAEPVALKVPGIGKDLPSLADVYADHFQIGTCVELNQFNGEEGELLLKHFSSLTAENIMKPQYIAPSKDKFFFDQADKLVEFAQKNGLLVRGHTLIWHSQDAKWMYYDDAGNTVSKEVLFQRMEKHIKTIVSRYKGKIYAWDVVNEVVNNGDLRDSIWYQISGIEYIEKAFRYAREADPDAKLFINDYGTNDPQKRDAIFNLVKSLLEKGVPIDGVGMQFHINLEYPQLSTIKASLDKFSALGLELHITELDMSLNGDSSLVAEEADEAFLIRQAYRYKEIFDLFKKYKSITNVTFWGFHDGHTWLTYFPVDKPDWPLIFDKNLMTKLAYWALVDPSVLPEDVVVTPPNNKFVATAKPGTPLVDGVKEALWNSTEALPVNILIEGSGSTAVGRVLWDEKNIYVFMEVADNLLSKASEDAYQEDCVEIFVDELNNKSADYLEDDAQYRLNFDNELTVKGNPAEIVSATTVTDKGYNVEVMIPIRFVKPAKGVAFGFDLQVNDDSGVGRRTSIAKWNDKTNDSFRNTIGFGTLVLGE